MLLHLFKQFVVFHQVGKAKGIVLLWLASHSWSTCDGIDLRCSFNHFVLQYELGSDDIFQLLFAAYYSDVHLARPKGTQRLGLLVIMASTRSSRCRYHFPVHSDSGFLGHDRRVDLWIPLRQLWRLRHWMRWGTYSRGSTDSGIHQFVCIYAWPNRLISTLLSLQRWIVKGTYWDTKTSQKSH